MDIFSNIDFNFIRHLVYTRSIVINLEELKLAIRGLTRQQELYRMLKKELKKQDHWKDKQRGNPRKAGKISYERRHSNK